MGVSFIQPPLAARKRSSCGRTDRSSPLRSKVKAEDAAEAAATAEAGVTAGLAVGADAACVGLGVVQAGSVHRASTAREREDSFSTGIAS
jgi:hypothetical protein